ncbi:MAG: ADP-ribosylglycohydrolase family protein [Armatimonadetes bacterium]|jgi:ADP-ribosylglycohydrolase|nr:ADP-ribosylglycohydrolase family protein [Armatimonadota bacterium]
MDAGSMDRIRGTLFGQAVGDALGLGTEFMSRAEVAQAYPGGLYRYEQIVQDAHRRRWVAGDWTDDTDQMLCILDSLLALQRVDLCDIAERLLTWAVEDGMGIGNTVLDVLADPGFPVDPHRAARRVWEQSGRRGAANGAVMRTCVVGLWHRKDAEQVRANAEQICRVTHFDPRCVGTCVAVSLAVAALTCGASVPEVLDLAAAEVARYHPVFDGWLPKVVSEPLDALDLDEGMSPGEPDRIGYTLKAAGAGFWALAHADSFEEGVLRIVHEGGDADTNAAVAGSLLGARFGFSAIPAGWVDDLKEGEALDQRGDGLIALLGGQEVD